MAHASLRSRNAAPRGIAQSVLNASILVEGTDAAIIKCTARKAFGRVQAGQVFWLVRSSKFANRYYAVTYVENRFCYECSCGACTKAHAHITAVNEYVFEHIVKQKASNPLQRSA